MLVNMLPHLLAFRVGQFRAQRAHLTFAESDFHPGQSRHRSIGRHVVEIVNFKKDFNHLTATALESLVFEILVADAFRDVVGPATAGVDLARCPWRGQKGLGAFSKLSSLFGTFPGERGVSVEGISEISGAMATMGPLGEHNKPLVRA